MSPTQEKKIIIIFEDHRDSKASNALRKIIRSDNACHISDITLEDNSNLPLSELIDRYKSIVKNVQVTTDPQQKAMASGFKASLNLPAEVGILISSGVGNFVNVAFTAYSSWIGKNFK